MKNIGTLLTVSLLFVATSQIWARQTISLTGKHYQIGGSAAYYNLASIDELYSPAAYSGANTGFGLKYINGDTRKEHQLSFRYATINRTPKSLSLNPNLFPENDSNLSKNSFLFEAFDQYRFLIENASSGSFKIYATGTWLTTVNITTNNFGVPELIQSGLGAGVYSEKILGRHILVAELTVPVISLTLRNNYSLSMTQNYEILNKLAFIKQNVQLQLPFSLLALYTNLGYQYNLSHHFIIDAEYSFRYMLNSSPRLLKSVSGIYSLGINYQF